LIQKARERVSRLKPASMQTVNRDGGGEAEKGRRTHKNEGLRICQSKTKLKSLNCPAISSIEPNSLNSSCRPNSSFTTSQVSL
jgi:hypothetical protein